MNNRTVLAISDQALEVINRRSPTTNKRGAWVSMAVIAYDKILTTQELTDPARLLRMENDLGEIKETLARLLAKE